MRLVVLVLAMLVACGRTPECPEGFELQDDGKCHQLDVSDGGAPMDVAVARDVTVPVDGATGPTRLCNQVPEVRCTASQACYLGHCYECGQIGQMACQGTDPDSGLYRETCAAGILARSCAVERPETFGMCFAAAPDGYGGVGQAAFSALVRDEQHYFCVAPARCSSFGTTCM